MRTLRRHFLYAEQETETSVGDHASKTNVLRQWLDRRREFLSTHEQIPRLLTLFWTLAKPTHATHLSQTNYVSFFQCVAKALVQSVGMDHAAAVATRDWLYDTSGSSASSDDMELSCEQFKEALLQCAELVLPAESDAPVFVSFFIELRNAIAAPAETVVSVGAAPEVVGDVVAYKLRGLRDVVKIRSEFLQKMPPNAEHLAQIRGLASPDMDRMSLKQLLLSYNPRKFSLSRKFSSLFAAQSTQATATTSPATQGIAEEGEPAVETPRQASSHLMPSSSNAPQFPSALLSRESEDIFDSEVAAVRSIESFPALRVAVVGPPGAGKTRVAQSLAKKLELQYVSMGMAIEDAIAKKKARDVVAAERARLKEEARAAAEAESAAKTAAEAPDAEAEASDVVTESAGGVAFDIQNGERLTEAAEDVDPDTAEAERLFNGEDLAMLLRGEAISRARTLPLLAAFARMTLLKGVGVVLDDVFPHEVQNVLTLDYVVSLEMAREDAQQHCAGLTVAPTSRRVYSVRERAMLAECDAVLQERGLLDSTGFAIYANQVTAETLIQEENEKRRVKVAEAMAAAAAAAIAASKPKATDSETEAEDTGAGTADEIVDEGSVDQEAPAVTGPVIISPADRNEITAPGEPTVPLRSLLLDTFGDRYREYEQRRNGFTSTTRTQVIVVLATQALHDVLAQCIVTITNNSHGLSRSATSRVVMPITLPEDVAASDARATQLRWLLYGDWTELLSASPPLTFSVGPVDPQQPRQLSRWRDCCPVASTGTTVVVGDPQCAAYFSGRVYMCSSLLAREQFCATPLQYLRREPPLLPPARKLWVVSSGTLDAPMAKALAAVVDGDHISATAIQRVPFALPEVAGLVADHLQGKEVWVLTDLIPSHETVATLKERGCLPDAIVVLTVGEEELPTIYKMPLERKKHELWSARFGAPDAFVDVLGEMISRIPVHRSPLYPQAHETQAALRRVLSPLAPRVDAVEDGTHRDPADAEEENVRVFGPSTDTEEEPPEAEGEDNPEKKEAASMGYSIHQQAWLTKRVRMGETAHFCAVSWHQKGVLVPGLPQFATSFKQKLYAFAGQQQRTAFERNPTLFVPSSAETTRDIVPVVWLLGVRGSEADSLARLLAQSVKADVKVGVVDTTAISSRVQRYLRSQLLLPREKQVPLTTLYLDELAAELEHMKKSGKWHVIVVSNISLAGVEVPLQLDDDGESPPTDAPSPLPTPELVAQCFERDLFPTLVLPLDASESDVVSRGLAQWRAALPPPRPRRKPKKTEPDAAEADEGDDAADLAELEAAESTRLLEQFARDHEALTAALESLRARSLAIGDSISINTTQRAVTKRMVDAISALLSRKASLFEFCERVSIRQAQCVLRSGQAMIGKHGVLCPITGEDALGLGVPALLYRGRLYFPRSHVSLAQCEVSPASTLALTVSQKPTCRVSCCVVGPPSTGKSTLARQLASRFGLAYVSPQNAIDWVLQCLGPQSVLWSKVKLARSISNKAIDPDLVHAAIDTRLRSADCQRLGWVLDGYMATSHELALCLGSSPIHPGITFVLEASFQRSWQVVQHLIPGSERELQHAQLLTTFTAWQKHRLDLLNTWTSTFGSFHIRQIDTDGNSAWQVSALAGSVLQQHLSYTRCYVREVAMRRPARLQGIMRAQQHIESRAHAVFQSFCPVELAESRYHASLSLHRELCVEYMDDHETSTVIWLASEANWNTFCSSVASFLNGEASERAQALMAKTPVDASLLSLLSVADCEFPEMKGYCPVTFKHGTGDKDWQAILKGSIFYRTSYGSKVFFCLNEHKRRLFVADPAKYASQILPTKLPPQLSASLASKNCPGRIEQELSGVLNETLLLLGASRPKFLGVSTRATACFYVALLLKTRAIKSLPDNIRAKYSEQLRAFEHDCRISELLKSVISPNGTTSCGTAVKGVRAVRELSSSASASSLVFENEPGATPSSATIAGGESVSADALRQRFDELARSLNHKASQGSSNQQPSTVYASSDAFLEYAKPLKR